MSTELLCPNGHFWEISLDGLSSADPARMTCPLCGLAFGATSADAPSDRTIVEASAILESPHQGELPTVPGYEVIGLLGQGGMGKVYKARHLRLNRLVALKMISAECASGQQLSRFQTEGQALAKLQHPHIVQIYEVAECNGAPYFALELLEGGGLDRKLGGLPQPPRDAARLIETLARAIHRAHQDGIVHRDLKPANILLNKEGEPKISDFGLAKRLEEDTNQTRTGDILGTPTYMAPEQAAGDIKTIGPLTDVYALGVIIYEMLTGRPPFRGVTSLETLQLIRFSDPVPPKRLQPSVPRDLETICLKCMEKAPGKRYASAEELADDLKRFQANQPIRARRAGVPERVAKWMRRHPAPSLLIGVIVLAILALGILGTWSNAQLRLLANRERLSARLARSVVDDLYTQFAEEWLAEEPYKDPVRQELLEKALRLYQEFAAANAADPEVRRETARAHFRMGQIHRILNEHAKAEHAYRQAIALQEDLRDRYPDDRSYRQDLANSHNWLGELFRQTGDLVAAEQNFARAEELQEKLLADSTREPTYRKELARSHYNRAIVLIDTSRPQLASKHLERAFDLLGGLHAQFPVVADYQHELALCFINRGGLHNGRRDLRKAEEDYKEAIRLLSPLTPTASARKGEQKGPFRVVYRIGLAVAHRNLGNLLWMQGKHEDAHREMKHALEILQRLAGDFPNRPAYQKKLAETYNSLGTVWASIKDHEQAEENYVQARALFERLVNEHGDVAEYVQLLGITVGNLGWLRTEEKDWAGARQPLEQAIQHLEKALKSNRKNPDCLKALRDQQQSLAETLIRIGDHAAAAAAATALADVYRDRGQDYYYAACFLSRCLPLVDRDPQLTDRLARKTCAHKYADEARAMLTKAKEVGGVSRLANEEEIFAPLMNQPAFQQILTDLGGKTKS